MTGWRSLLRSLWWRLERFLSWRAFPPRLPLSQWEVRPPLVRLDCRRVGHLESAVLYRLAPGTFRLSYAGLGQWDGLRPACPNLSLSLRLWSDAAAASQVGPLEWAYRGRPGDRVGTA